MTGRAVIVLDQPNNHDLSHEAMALLYVSGELPAGDRVRFEARLASDPALREAVSHVEAAHDWFTDAMARLEPRRTASEDAALHRLGQVVRQHITEQGAAGAKPAATMVARDRFPAWAYPIAAAALIAIGLVGFWGLRPDKRIVMQPTDPGRRPILPMPQGYGGPPGNGFPPFNVHPYYNGQNVPRPDESDPANELAHNFEAGNPMQSDDSMNSLDTAEEEITELDNTPDQNTASYFGFADGNE